MSFLTRPFFPVLIALVTFALFAGAPRATDDEETPGCAAAAHPEILTVTAAEGAVTAPWHTLSGLTAHPKDPTRLFAVADEDSEPARIFELAVKDGAATVLREIVIKGEGIENLDLEGVTAKSDGGFWLVSEGDNDGRPNLLLEVDSGGTILHVVPLSKKIDRRTKKKGFEGVAIDEEAEGPIAYAALQEPLEDDDEAEAESDTEYRTRIAAYDPGRDKWRFFLYPLAATGDQAGVSELLHLGDKRFAAIERDNKAGAAAKLKLVTTFDLTGLEGAGPQKAAPTAKNKQTAVDLIGFYARNGCPVDEQIEGLAVAADGEVYAVVDHNKAPGTPLLHLGRAGDLFAD